jgi:hypothetical protein
MLTISRRDEPRRRLRVTCEPNMVCTNTQASPQTSNRERSDVFSEQSKKNADEHFDWAGSAKTEHDRAITNGVRLARGRPKMGWRQHRR